MPDLFNSVAPTPAPTDVSVPANSIATPTTMSIAPVAPVAPTQPAQSTQPISSGSGSTPAPTLNSPSPVAKAGFVKGFEQGMRGPSFKTNDSGQIESNDQPRNTKGFLGSVLAGALFGALNGAASVKQGERGGAAFASGVTRDQQVRNEQKEQAKALAQQNFQNKNAVQKLDDEHKEAIARTNQAAAATQGQIQLNQHNAKLFPLVEQSEEQGIKEGGLRLENGEKESQKLDLDLMKAFADSGAPVAFEVSSHKDANEHIPGVVGGKLLAVNNGQAFNSPQYGAVMYEHDAVKGNILVKDTQVPVYSGAWNNDGTPHKDMITLAAGTPLLKYYGAYYSAKQQVNDMTAIQGKQVEDGLKKAQTNEASGNAAAKFAEAKKTTQDAQLTATLNAPGSENSTGPDYVKTLPPGIGAPVQAIAEGRMELSPRLLSTKQGQVYATALTRAYPDWDQSKGQTWFKSRNEYMGTGATAKKVVSYNTALEHMQALYQHSTAEGLYNPVSKDYQDRQVELNFVSQEVGNAVKNGVMSKDEGQQILGGLKGLTPGTSQERVAETARLLHDKIEEYQNKLDSAKPSDAVHIPTLISPKAAGSYDFVQSGGKNNPAANSAGSAGSAGSGNPLNNVPGLVIH